MREATEKRSSRGLNIFLWVLNLIALAFLVVVLIAAIGNLIGMFGIAASLGTSVSITGIFWLVFALLLPVGSAIAALVIGRRKPVTRTVLLLTALALNGLWQIELLYLIPPGAYFA